MNSFDTLSVAQLKKAVSLREKIESLQSELNKILGGSSAAAPKTGRRTMSAAGRARVAAAQKARWAKSKASRDLKKASQDNKKIRHKGKRKMSAAGRAAISKAAKARWAKAKAAGKSKL